MVQRIGVAAPARWWAGGFAWSRALALVRRVEPVDLVEQRYNFLPHSFRWRGAMRRVRRVARVWEQQGSAARSPRRYFEVTCGGGGSYVLFQDLRVGTWHMSM
jgi:hypothetical protein